MKNESKIRSVLSVSALLLTLACPALAATAGETPAGAGSWFTDPNTPSDVQAAHDAFLQGDFPRMAIAIKRALIGHPGDGDIRRDLLELYDKAYALRGDRAVRPDWTLPKGMGFAQVTFKKRYGLATGDILYRLSAYVEIAPTVELEQLQIIRYPGGVIVDKQAGIGYQELGKVGAGGTSFFTCEDYHTVPSAEGLYLLNMKVRNQPMIEGWFVMSRMNAIESPNVITPSLNQELSSGTPTFQWDNFVSTDYRTYESRKSTAAVYSNPRGKDDVWANYNLAPSTSVTVGTSGEDFEGVAALPPGQYMLEISGKERYHFGELTLSRDSGTSVPFGVK